MYDIKFNKEKVEYTFEVEGKVVDNGNLEAMTWTALEYGINNDELNFAFNQMAENKHTEANFGIYGCFIFSK